MTALSLQEALVDACKSVGVEPPRRGGIPGRFVRTDTTGKNGKNDASVLIFDDETGGIVWNHQTAQQQQFRLDGSGQGKVDPDIERRRRERDAQVERERAVVAEICERIVRGCRTEAHPYLKRKGFPSEVGLVCDDPREFFPGNRLGETMAKALPDGEGPLLIIPGRIGKRVATVQFITADGAKKNILRGQMSGASHRIASGGETVVCEGYGTALSVRAALRLLGRRMAVLCAFSASNVGQVASAIPGAVIAADHDKPVEGLDGLGAGEFYARRSGRAWFKPSVEGEDFNDMHQRHGLRAVALQLREALG